MFNETWPNVRCLCSLQHQQDVAVGEGDPAIAAPQLDPDVQADAGEVESADRILKAAGSMRL
jgi:hypothetical protein